MTFSLEITPKLVSVNKTLLHTSMNIETEGNMKDIQILEGGFYTNEQKGLIRQVIELRKNGDVYWRSFLLSNGQPTGDRLMCSKATLIRWADREASTEEIVRLQLEKADRHERVRFEKLLNDLVEQTGFSYEELIDSLQKMFPNRD